MTDKDTRPYHYEPYPGKANNTSSLKRNEIKTSSNASSLIHNPTSKQSGGGSKCCCCTISSRSATFWASFLTNLGICTLLFGYTLLGKWFWQDYHCNFIPPIQGSFPDENKPLIKQKLFRLHRLVYISRHRRWCVTNATKDAGVNKSTNKTSTTCQQ